MNVQFAAMRVVEICQKTKPSKLLLEYVEADDDVQCIKIKITPHIGRESLELRLEAIAADWLAEQHRRDQKIGRRKRKLGGGFLDELVDRILKVTEE